MRFIGRVILFCIVMGMISECMALPKGFVYLSDVDPTIVQDMKYFTTDNFLGRPVTGYRAPVCILTVQAAQALKTVQQELRPQGLGLKVYDCYRPQMAVDDFVKWSRDTKDQKMKAAHYPNVDKRDFFKLGYVMEKSSHTRGSTVDVTIIDLASGKKLPMGTVFDYMDELSHPLTGAVTAIEKKNRLFLRLLMEQAGFAPLETEWWHFTLDHEPFPDTYFNFEVA